MSVRGGAIGASGSISDQGGGTGTRSRRRAVTEFVCDLVGTCPCKDHASAIRWPRGSIRGLRTVGLAPL